MVNFNSTNSFPNPMELSIKFYNKKQNRIYIFKVSSYYIILHILLVYITIYDYYQQSIKPYVVHTDAYKCIIYLNILPFFFAL